MGLLRSEEEAVSRKIYLDGLKKYKDKGIPILIDGLVATEQDLGRIFDDQEDGSFYMGDFISQKQGIAEDGGEYGEKEIKERLIEIHFDKVYNK